MKQSVSVIKESGEVELFSETKYRRSLRRSGASNKLITQILEEIYPKMYDGISTKEIYRLTREYLKVKKKRALAGRYDLKKAIMQLGPSGYPFEKFVGELFKIQGYEVEVNKEIPGRCVPHEVDLFAKKGNRRFIIECKFHSRGGLRSNVKVPLYIKARYDDIQEACESNSSCDQTYDGCFLVTNTKFTSVAIDYGECRNLKMIAWAYPEGKSLENIIDIRGLHPITCLSTISEKIKKDLLKRNVVLCRNIEENVALLKQLQLSENKIKEILSESQAICEGK